jgi:hypothetical protein
MIRQGFTANSALAHIAVTCDERFIHKPPAPGLMPPKGLAG